MADAIREAAQRLRDFLCDRQIDVDSPLGWRLAELDRALSFPHGERASELVDARKEGYSDGWVDALKSAATLVMAEREKHGIFSREDDLLYIADRIWSLASSPWDIVEPFRRECPECGGTGSISNGQKYEPDCARCGGKGSIR